MLENPSSSNNTKNKKGCVFYGCLTVSIIIGIMLIFFGIFTYQIYKTLDEISNEIATLSTDTPRITATEQLPLEEVRNFEYNLNKQLRLAEANQEATLTFTSEEISLLLTQLFKKAHLPGNFITKLSNNSIVIDSSVYISNISNISNKYSNSTITLEKADIPEQGPTFIIKDIVFNENERIPFLEKIIGSNILFSLNFILSPYINKAYISSMDLKDNKVVIKLTSFK